MRQNHNPRDTLVNLRLPTSRRSGHDLRSPDFRSSRCACALPMALVQLAFHVSEERASDSKPETTSEYHLFLYTQFFRRCLNASDPTANRWKSKLSSTRGGHARLKSSPSFVKLGLYAGSWISSPDQCVCI